MIIVSYNTNLSMEGRVMLLDNSTGMSRRHSWMEGVDVTYTIVKTIVALELPLCGSYLVKRYS